ncbi:MAG TPA: hypothetical protein VIV60_14720, partial [Polyangiaceae bacterium]
VAMNPIIKFTTLFGLLAVELAEGLPGNVRTFVAIPFGAVMLYFVWRSFYTMRIVSTVKREAVAK